VPWENQPSAGAKIVGDAILEVDYFGVVFESTLGIVGIDDNTSVHSTYDEH